ncbi:MAG: hypothetical protein WBF93_02870 [Pirellulales bacterium]|jgi:hypothetical protein
MRFLLALSIVLAPVGANSAQELTDETFTKWLDYVRPKPEELRWRRIPWRTVFWEAMQEANAADRPVLLWAMNGHPFGCT